MTIPGIYDHYKGGKYRVMFVAKNSTNGQDEGTPMVVYVSLTTGRVHVRDEAEFNDRKMHEGVMVNRFTWTGEP